MKANSGETDQTSDLVLHCLRIIWVNAGRFYENEILASKCIVLIKIIEPTWLMSEFPAQVINKQ